MEENRKCDCYSAAHASSVCFDSSHGGYLILAYDIVMMKLLNLGRRSQAKVTNLLCILVVGLLSLRPDRIDFCTHMLRGHAAESPSYTVVSIKSLEPTSPLRCNGRSWFYKKTYISRLTVTMVKRPGASNHLFSN